MRKVYDDRIEWRNDRGQLHRLDGPAIEWNNVQKEWYVNDELHREDGPAIEWSNGDREWYQFGKLHRIDGPAIEYADGGSAFWYNGKIYPSAEKLFEVLDEKDKISYLFNINR